jgi:hypothetical protein
MVRFATANYIGTKLMALARKNSSSKSRSVAGKRVTAQTAKSSVGRTRSSPASGARTQHFAVCVRNDNYRASLELRKLYPVLDDAFADQHAMIRIVDESGEDYLYPAAFFMRVELPTTVERTLLKIA